MKRLMMAVLLVMVAAGCNTVQGLGRDIEAGGEALQRAGRK